eukprot:5841555-Ditylum_brightwellii.AAC.1
MEILWSMRPGVARESWVNVVNEIERNLGCKIFLSIVAKLPSNILRVVPVWAKGLWDEPVGIPKEPR